MKFTQKEKDFALRLSTKYSSKKFLSGTPFFSRIQSPSTGIGVSGFFLSDSLPDFTMLTGMYELRKEVVIFSKYLKLKNKRRGILDRYDYSDLYHSALSERKEYKEPILLQEKDLIERGFGDLSSLERHKLFTLKRKRTGIAYSFIPKEEEKLPSLSLQNPMNEQPITEERGTIFSKIKRFFTDLL